MDKQQDMIDTYLRSAAREAREGNVIRATMWRNEAWLLEHPEGWLAHVRMEANGV